jgi:hypothetical protein
MSAHATIALHAVPSSQIQPISGHSAHMAALTAARIAPLPTRITRYQMTAEQVPVDFFADPDGSWEFSPLVEMAGFNPEHPGASVGALTQPFDGFPEGAAVITEVGVDCRYVAIAQLPAIETAAKSAGNSAALSGDSRAVAAAAAARSVASQRPHRAA